MIRPDGVREVRVAEHPVHAVPVRIPDVVQRVVVRVLVDRGLVAHARGRTAVHPGDVPLHVQLADPGADEVQHAGHAGRVGVVVGLHVEVNRVTGREADQRRLCCRVVRRVRSLGCRLGRDDPVREPAARRLQSHVDRDQVPALPFDGHHPRRRQVGLVAAPVDATDVDPDASHVGGEPRVHGIGRRRRARVEAFACVDRSGPGWCRGSPRRPSRLRQLGLSQWRRARRPPERGKDPLAQGAVDPEAHGRKHAEARERRDQAPARLGPLAPERRFPVDRSRVLREPSPADRPAVERLHVHRVRPADEPGRAGRLLLLPSQEDPRPVEPDAGVG